MQASLFSRSLWEYCPVGLGLVTFHLLAYICVLTCAGIPPTTSCRAAMQKETRFSRLTPMYTVIDLGTLPNCENNSPKALNSQVQVTGTATFDRDRNLSYLWEQGSLRSLGTLGGMECDANYLNDNGQVVGVSTTARGEKRAFVWHNDTMVDLGTLGGADSYANAINNPGQVIGYATIPSGEAHPVLWDQDGIHDLNALLPSNSMLERINDREQIIGTTKTRRGYDSFLLDHNKVTRIPAKGGTYCLANGLNAQGDVVGLYRINQELRAFLWKNGRLLDLGTLGGSGSSALDINNTGQIVGLASINAEESHAFLWQDGKMQDLNALVLQDSGWELESAVSINDKGDIIGTGTRDGRPGAFLLMPILRHAELR